MNGPPRGRPGSTMAAAVRTRTTSIVKTWMEVRFLLLLLLRECGREAGLGVHREVPAGSPVQLV
jgi:hypothetical protein